MGRSRWYRVFVIALGLASAAVLPGAGCLEVVGTLLPGQTIEDVTPAKACELIQAPPVDGDFVIIDIRTPSEYEAEHLEGAVNIDYYAESFREELEALDRETTYLIYCRTGRRAAGALTIMRELGFMHVYNIAGGIVRWNADSPPCDQ